MELAWLQKCTPDYLKLSEVSTIRTFSSRKWQGFAFSSALWGVEMLPHLNETIEMEVAEYVLHKVLC